jgi:hypothetical protein
VIIGDPRDFLGRASVASSRATLQCGFGEDQTGSSWWPQVRSGRSLVGRRRIGQG